MPPLEIPPEHNDEIRLRSRPWDGLPAIDLPRAVHDEIATLSDAIARARITAESLKILTRDADGAVKRLQNVIRSARKIRKPFQRRKKAPETEPITPEPLPPPTPPPLNEADEYLRSIGELD